MLDPADVNSYIITAARDCARELLGDAADDIPIGDGTNLLTAGLLDSLSFTSLLADVEQRFRVELDLFDLDPAVFSSVGGLTSAVVKCLRDDGRI